RLRARPGGRPHHRRAAGGVLEVIPHAELVDHPALPRSRRHPPRQALRPLRPGPDREGLTMATATGVYHTSYRKDFALRHTKAEYARLVLLIVSAVVLPFRLDHDWLGYVDL